jgi:hypothetical protein
MTTILQINSGHWFTKKQSDHCHLKQEMSEMHMQKKKSSKMKKKLKTILKHQGKYQGGNNR